LRCAPQNDLGIGDTAAVKELIEWCARHGFHVLQVLPINETGPDNSPYNAISAMALEPTTITTTPAALPDLLPADFERITSGAASASLQTGPVRYRQVKALKRELLWAAFQRAGQRKEVANFAKANDWLEHYTLYRALLDENRGRDDWESWPPEHQSPSRREKRWRRTQNFNYAGNFMRMSSGLPTSNGRMCAGMPTSTEWR